MIKEVIPTILAKTFAEVKEKIRQVENFVKWIQIDVADGVFVDNKTWANPEDLKKLKIKAKLEIHLMVEDPEEVINDWLEVADRIIIHSESDCQIEKIIKIVKDKNKEIGLALNPETSVDKVRPFFNKLDLILLMTV